MGLEGMGKIKQIPDLFIGVVVDSIPTIVERI